MREETQDVLTCFYPAGWDGSQLWYCDLYHGALCRADLERGTNAFVALLPLPSDAAWIDRWYGCAMYAAGHVVIAPLGAEKIAAYDVASGDMTLLPLPENRWNKKEWYSLFQDAFSWGGCAYLVPGRYNRILKVDPVAGRVSELAGDYKALRPWRHPVANGVCGHAVVGDKAYLSYWQENVMVEIDLRRDTARVLRVPGKKHIFTNVCTHDGETFWLTTLGVPDVVRWNRKTEDVREYRINLPGMTFWGGTYFIFDGGDCLWLGGTSNALVRMDKATGRMTAPVPLTLEQVPTPVPSAGGTFLSATDIDGGRVALSCVYTGEIAVFDPQTGAMRTFPSVLDEPDAVRRILARARRARWQPGGDQLYGECERWPLAEFLGALSAGTFEEAGKNVAQEDAGTSIYHAVAAVE